MKTKIFSECLKCVDVGEYDKTHKTQGVFQPPERLGSFFQTDVD